MPEIREEEFEDTIKPIRIPLFQNDEEVSKVSKPKGKAVQFGKPNKYIQYPMIIDHNEIVPNEVLNIDELPLDLIKVDDYN